MTVDFIAGEKIRRERFVPVKNLPEMAV